MDWLTDIAAMVLAGCVVAFIVGAAMVALRSWTEGWMELLSTPSKVPRKEWLQVMAFIAVVMALFVLCMAYVLRHRS